MSQTNYCTPLTVKLTEQLQLRSVYSIGDSTGLDITGCEYADLINFDTILSAKSHQEYSQISIVKNSTFLNIARQMSKDDLLGVLLLYIQSNRVILFIDDERELLIDIVRE